MFKWIFFSLNLGSLPLILSLTTTERHGSSLLPSIKFLYRLRRSLQTFPSWSLCSSLSLSLHGREPSGVGIFVAPHWTHSMSLYLTSPEAQNCPLHTMCGLTHAEQRGRITSLSSLEIIFLIQLWVLLATFYCKVTLLVYVLLYYPKGLFCKDSFWLVRPQPALVRLFLLDPLLNFVRFLSAHFFSLLRFVWMASQSPGLSNTSHNFVSSLNLLRLHSVLLSTQLNYDAQNAHLHT